MAILSAPDRILIQPFSQLLYQFSYYHSYCYSSKIYWTYIFALQGENEGLCLLIPKKHAVTISGGEELWTFMELQTVFSKFNASNNNQKKKS